MADQRAFGNTDKSPAEVGTQVRDRAQEAGAQVRDRAQEAAVRSVTEPRKLVSIPTKPRKLVRQVRDRAKLVLRSATKPGSWCSGP